MIKRGPIPKTNYTVLANQLLTDRRLSLAASGLLVHLLSKPENWTVSPSALANECKEGKGKIYKLLKELTDLKYAIRAVNRAKGGRISQCDFEIYDRSVTQYKEEEVQLVDLQEVVKQEVVKQEVVKQEVVLQELAEQEVVNRPLQSKDSTKNRDNKVTSKETSKETRKRSPTPKVNFDSWPNQPEPQILNDWLLVRKGKKSALTQTAINRIAKQLWLANQAGYSVDDCIGLCCERSWAAYKFEWHQNHLQQAGQTNGSPKKPNSLQTAHRDINEEFYRAQAEIAAADPVEADDPAIRSQVDYSLPDVRQRARKS